MEDQVRKILKINKNIDSYNKIADEYESQFADYATLLDLAKELSMIGESWDRALPYVAPELPENQKRVANAQLAVYIAECIDKAEKKYGKDSRTVEVLEQLLDHYKSQAKDYFKE